MNRYPGEFIDKYFEKYLVRNHEIIPVEEARRRGLVVPDAPGETVHLFSYQDPTTNG